MSYSSSFRQIPGEANPDIVQTQLILSNALQSSLDVGDTVSAFYSIVQKAVLCSGLRYTNTAGTLDLMLGDKAPHRVSYNLKTDENAYGTLEVFSTTAFDEAILSGLEALIGTLLYPLRNALLYREALENSLRDPLTGVGNRAALELTLKRELELARRNEQPLSVLVMDIDHFKQVNDTCGHSFGDQVIREVAQAIGSSLRQTDQVFRYGGEEFVVVLSGTEHAPAMQVAERVRSAVARLKLQNTGTEVPVSVSVGVTTTHDNDTRDSLIERGDSALYIAKRLGRNCVVSGGGQQQGAALASL